MQILQVLAYIIALCEYLLTEQGILFYVLCFIGQIIVRSTWASLRMVPINVWSQLQHLCILGTRQLFESECKIRRKSLLKFSSLSLCELDNIPIIVSFDAKEYDGIAEEIYGYQDIKSYEPGLAEFNAI